MATFEEKVAAAKELLASKGVARPAYAPSIVTWLWKMGIKVPPPHFAGVVGTFLFTSIFFGTIWGVIMWFVHYRPKGLPASAALTTAAMVGLGVGVLVAAYYRVSAKKHAIPRWSEFEPGRTTRT
jgi:hypothetical protein